MQECAQVERRTFEPGRRVVAISDLHGMPSFFHGLLKGIGFDRRDILILLGDLVEKGPHSLELLRDVIALSEQYTVHTVCGNCDRLVYRFADEDGSDQRAEEFYRSYLRQHPESTIWQLAGAAGCTSRDTDPEGFSRMRSAIRQTCARELDFLRGLPHILETEHLLFVHGGVPSGAHMEQLPAFAVMKNDDFMSQGYAFEKYCVVGHWPVTLYDPAIPSARPVIDRDRRIISIDGGCALKLDGQLNALIIPEEGSEAFRWAAYDGLERVRAQDFQQASRDSVNIRWGHNQVERLEEGEELSLCRHLETGRVMPILNDYLYRDREGLRCRDSTDYLLPVQPGDSLALVAMTRDGILGKKEGVTGWYRGRFTIEREQREYVEILPLD